MHHNGEVTKVTTFLKQGVAGKRKPAIDGSVKLLDNELLVAATSPQGWWQKCFVLKWSAGTTTAVTKVTTGSRGAGDCTVKPRAV